MGAEMYLGVGGTIGAERVGVHEHGRYWHEEQKKHAGGRARLHDAEVIALRTSEEPMGVEAIAAKLAITTGTVLNILRRNGLQGKHRVKSNRKSKIPHVSTLENALDEYGGMYVERADMPDGKDGYICTIRDEYPGCACTTIAAAIRSAVACMPRELECAVK